jgi:hypothetical protein
MLLSLMRRSTERRLLWAALLLIAGWSRLPERLVGWMIELSHVG